MQTCRPTHKQLEKHQETNNNTVTYMVYNTYRTQTANEEVLWDFLSQKDSLIYEMVQWVRTSALKKKSNINYNMLIKSKVAMIHPAGYWQWKLHCCVCGGASHILCSLCASYMTESYKHGLPCYPTIAAQKCPWPPLGSQVAGGAGQNQEA